MVGLSLNLPKLNTGPFVFSNPSGWQETPKRVATKAMPSFDDWLELVTPAYQWRWNYLVHIRQHLDMITSGQINRLMLFVPPRHGKSSMVTVRYPVWRMERQPDLRVIVGAYNQTLVNRFSRQARRIAQSRFELDPERYAVEEWQTQAGGTFRAVGVGGGVTGQGGDLIIIDDPVKSREEAESETYRQQVEDWYTDDLFTRREPGAAIILIMTRWHEDDLAGRILASEDGPNWTVVKLPAEAEEHDPLGRQVGEALCPQRYDLDALAEIKTVLRNSYFALFQQRPTAKEGEMFKRAWFKIIKASPAAAERVRYWDKAGTEGGGAFTCGALMARGDNKRFCVEDVRRGQWSAGEREKIIRQTAELDKARFGRVEVVVEQEPGSGGKESAESTILNLAGFRVSADKVTGDKVIRAEPFAAQCEAGNVDLLEGDWNAGYLDRLAAFPMGKYKDDVDASSGAFNKLALAIDNVAVHQGVIRGRGGDPMVRTSTRKVSR